MHHAEVDEIYRGNIQRLLERGAFTPPCHEANGARCQSPPAREEDWREIKKLWEGDES
jgi:hypothetical protein